MRSMGVLNDLPKKDPDVVVCGPIYFVTQLLLVMWVPKIFSPSSKTLIILFRGYHVKY